MHSAALLPAQDGVLTLFDGLPFEPHGVRSGARRGNSRPWLSYQSSTGRCSRCSLTAPSCHLVTPLAARAPSVTQM